MQTCSQCHALSPDSAKSCEQCHADLSQFSTTAMALKRIRENPRIAYVRIAVNHDCCPACRQAEGAYTKENVLVLPVEGCSHPLGCRCYYQPVLGDLFP
ncbi:MAG: hypothetical protein JW908_08765 [Anaerolineales bacterium]|nr:hypothetical protein [Anaerolineales bacterium]